MRRKIIFLNGLKSLKSAWNNLPISHFLLWLSKWVLNFLQAKEEFSEQYECVIQVSILSTFYVHIFHTNIVSAAFSSYILALAKNLYKKSARITLMKLTTGWTWHWEMQLWLLQTNLSFGYLFQLLKNTSSDRKKFTCFFLHNEHFNSGKWQSYFTFT